MRNKEIVQKLWTDINEDRYDYVITPIPNIAAVFFFFKHIPIFLFSVIIKRSRNVVGMVTKDEKRDIYVYILAYVYRVC